MSKKEWKELVDDACVHRNLRNLHHGIDHTNSKGSKVDASCLFEVMTRNNSSRRNKDKKREQVVGAHGVEHERSGFGINCILDNQQDDDSKNVGNAADESNHPVRHTLDTVSAIDHDGVDKVEYHKRGNVR